jgi:opacity protein-like surface antigen
MRRLWLKRAGLAITILAVASVASAQDKGRFEASLGFTGVYSKTSNASLGTASLTPTTSGGILASFRYHLKHLGGLEVNYSHTNNSQIYSVPGDTYRVMNGITEFTGDLVISPFHFKKIEPFAFAGGGSLKFNPGNQYIDGNQVSFGAKSERTLSFLYGGGLDYPLKKSIALRMQYRGLLYKAPDFDVATLYTGANGHMAEPSIGIVFKF